MTQRITLMRQRFGPPPKFPEKILVLGEWLRHDVARPVECYACAWKSKVYPYACLYAKQNAPDLKCDFWTDWWVGCGAYQER